MTEVHLILVTVSDSGDQGQPAQNTRPNLLSTPHYPFPKRQILDSSKLKEFADDNFKFDENGKESSK